MILPPGALDRIFTEKSSPATSVSQNADAGGHTGLTRVDQILQMPANSVTKSYRNRDCRFE